LNRDTGRSGRNVEDHNTTIWMLDLISFDLEMQSLKQPSPCPLKGIECPGSNNTARLLIGHAKHKLPPSLVSECNTVLHEIIELVATLALLKLEVFVLWTSY
jgi:hypothetical protein